MHIYFGFLFYYSIIMLKKTIKKYIFYFFKTIIAKNEQKS